MDELPIRTGDDVVRVRQQVRVVAAKTGLSRVEVVTSALGKSGVRIGFTDEGPGIADVDLALTDGWSSGVGLGLGLSGARRLVDEFELTSKPGTGTSVVVVKWSR
jgi:serine/threonine-protein kinase RsbT